jgi:hypothetical protein
VDRRGVREWQHLYREIFRMAKERGLDTYVVFWSIFVSEEFAKAHNVATENFYPHYYVSGDTSEITKRYLRESVTQMLEEYPDLDGIGVSHGEGMGGMTPLARQQFVDEVFIAGALNAKRKQPVKLIHRVPFSSGLSSGPGVSTDVEKITRTAMEKLGNKFSGPIWAEMKFNWSHGHSTPKLIKVHGGALGDTYFKPTPSNYKIVQVRNEDFFALRWGVPDLIRQHRAVGRTTSAATSWDQKPTFPRSFISLPQRTGVRQWAFSANGCCTNSVACSTTKTSAVPGRFAPLWRPGIIPLQAYALASNTPDGGVSTTRGGTSRSPRKACLIARRVHELHRRRCADQAAHPGSGVSSCGEYVRGVQAGKSFGRIHTAATRRCSSATASKGVGW